MHTNFHRTRGEDFKSAATLQENNFGDEVFLKVERPFCCGLQNANPDVRNRFFKLYSERVPRDLYERLKYIISVQEWEFLSNTFWLKHAVVCHLSRVLYLI